MTDPDGLVAHARLEVDLACDVARALEGVMAYRGWDAPTAVAAAIAMMNKAMADEVVRGVPAPRGPSALS